MSALLLCINRMMYWTDHGSSPRIEKASMDGTLRTVIHSTGLVRPGGITLDYTTQTLYWVDSSLDRMESSDVNGLNRRVLITAGIQHPLAIDVFQGTLFWTDSDRGAILSAHVAQPNNSRVIVPNVIGAAMAVKVVSLERQQSGILFMHSSKNLSRDTFPKERLLVKRQPIDNVVLNLNNYKTYKYMHS